jgi:hypothetical protein
MMRWLIILTFCLNSLVGFNQQVSISEKISRGDIFTNEKEFAEWVGLCGKDTVKLFENLSKSRSDSVSEERLNSSLAFLKDFVAKSSNKAVKSEVINFILVVAKSKHSSVVAKSFRLLQNIPAKYFGKSALDTIEVMIRRNQRNYSDAILLAGYLNEPVFVDVIKHIFLNSRGFTRQEQWTTYRVLARLGDKDALTYCVKKVTALPVNDQVVDVLFPDLVYTRQKEAIDVLIKVLNSDELLCSSTNPNNDGKILCGYRIMEMLAPVIESFPLKTLPSGDLDVKDYSKALIEVRRWFQANNNYKIVK